MTHKTIQADLSESYHLDRFCVTADLLGARHEFTFFGKAITVELPLDQESSTTPHELRRVVCYKWRAEGNIPLEYQVNRIAMRIAVGEPLSIPEEALKESPRRDELFTNAEREQFDKLIGSLTPLAVDAFRYWMAVLRWISRNAYIGEPGVKPADALGLAALQEKATRHRFWHQNHWINARLEKAVTMAEWQSAQVALSQNKEPPIWFEFLFEGAQRINNRDLTGGVLSLAIALESIVRNLVVTQRASVQLILDLMPKLKFWNQDWEREADLDRFKKLMTWRNRVMHSADISDLNEQDLRKTYAKLKTFAYFVSEYLAH
jgi:hypothetical protein